MNVSSPVFPGAVAHFKYDIAKEFHDFTLKEGEAASTYFEKSGIRNLALNNDGICTFSMDGKPVVYQVTNVPLVDDLCLSPSVGAHQDLFGEFMGTYPSDSLIRKKKRKPLLKKLANANSLKKMKPFIQKYARDYLTTQEDTEHNLEDFSLRLVTYVDSFLPGIIDVRNKPLTSYLASSEYREIMRDFFKFAADAISNLDKNALNLVQSIVPFVRNLIYENFESISKSPDSNIIKQYLALEGHILSKDAVLKLPDCLLKQLGTIIVSLYETTSLSLYWLICFIENNPKIKEKIIYESRAGEFSLKKISYIEFVVLEAIRLGGSNPTVFWRETIVPTDIYIKNTKIHVEKGTLFCLDRRNANQDKNIFACPHFFEPDNIQSLLKGRDKTLFSLLSHDRYEVNSFSMVNTFDNPRKCPGRFFSIFEQSCLIREIYSRYEVNTRGVSVDKLRKYCSMARPDNAAKIRISLRKEDD